MQREKLRKRDLYLNRMIAFQDTPFLMIMIKRKAVTRQPEFLPTADNRFCLPIGNMAGKYRHLVFSEPFLSHQTLIFTPSLAIFL